MSDTTKQPLRRGQDNKKTTKTKTNNGKNLNLIGIGKHGKLEIKYFQLYFYYY